MYALSLGSGRMLAVPLVLSTLLIATEHIVSCSPNYGFNLPPLGIDGKNVDYHDTSPRFFAGMLEIETWNVSGVNLISRLLFQISSSTLPR